jgi:hypothetical protein
MPMTDDDFKPGHEPLVQITDLSTGNITLIRGIGPNVTVNSGIQIFDFTLTPAQIDGSAAVTLGYGNLSGNGISLNSGVQPYPNEFSGTNTPPWTDTKPVTGDPSTLWYAYIIVTVNLDPAGDGSAPPVISSISWDTYTTPQTNSDDGTTGYILLGTGFVSEDGSTATTLNATGIGDQVVTWCAGLFYFFPSGYAAATPE